MLRTPKTIVPALLAALIAASIPSAIGFAADAEPSLQRLSLDRRFRGNGATLARLGFDVVDHVRIDSADRIVVAGGKLAFGQVGTGEEVYAPLVARLLPNGRVDGTFGVRGVVQPIALGRPTGLALGASFGGDDRIVVFGDFVGAHARRVGAVRLLRDGSIDGSYGDGGQVAMLPAAPGAWKSPAFDVRTGTTTVVATEGLNSRLVRLTGSGTFDDSFGNGGVVAMDGFDVRDLTVDAGGRVIVGRKSNVPPVPPGGEAGEIVRFAADGSPDASFGGDGRLHGPGGGTLTALWIRLDADKRLVVQGFDTDGRLGFYRFLEDGSLDASFSEDGFARDASGVPGNAERGQETLAIAPASGGAYVEVGGLTFYSRTLNHPIASGFFVQSVDPADPTAMRSLVVRDRRPIARAVTSLTSEAISADGATVVVGGFVQFESRAGVRTEPVLLRANLAASAPVPLPDVRLATVKAIPMTAADGSFRLALTLDIANDGAGLWTNGNVAFHLSEDEALDPSDYFLGTWSTGAVPHGQTVRFTIATGSYALGDVPSLSGRRVIAVLNPDGQTTETGGANAVVASTAFR